MLNMASRKTNITFGIFSIIIGIVLIFYGAVVIYQYIKYNVYTVLNGGDISLTKIEQYGCVYSYERKWIYGAVCVLCGIMSSVSGILLCSK